MKKEKQPFKHNNRYYRIVFLPLYQGDFTHDLPEIILRSAHLGKAKGRPQMRTARIIQYILPVNPV